MSGKPQSAACAPAAATIERAGVRPVRRANGRRTGAARLEEWAPFFGDSLGEDERLFHRMPAPSGNAGPAR